MGRRKKKRPRKGEPIEAGMSHRDIAATGVMSRGQIDTALAVHDVPTALFEALIESDSPATVTQLAALGRALRKGDLSAHCTEREARAFLAGRSARNKRTCPHCGGDL